MTDIPGLINIVKFESPSYAPYNENVIIAQDSVHKDEDKLLESPGYQIIYACQNPNGGTDTILGSESGAIIDDHTYFFHTTRHAYFFKLLIVGVNELY